jgi:prolyl-tRNA synthetase
MRWTQTLIPTLKETPAEAEIVSHKLLLRAGLIRKLTGGLYTFLPLGLRALRKVEQIVREEMNRAGALELLMPALQPPDIWQQSGRYEAARDVLFKVRDRARKEWVLGPTHEEVITTLVAGEINSYRQMPKNFYQIQTKFRDEIRPRFGLMRAKEFIMKDAYSFDATDEAAQESYRKMYEAYARIFQRCGLKAIPVEADTGVMGGKFSHEFMVPAESGENEVVFCDKCHYAANVEKATSAVGGPQSTVNSPQSTAEVELPLEEFPTPGVVTIDALSQAPFNVPAHRQIKTLVYIADSKPVLLLLRGDDQLNEAKLAGVLGTGQIRPADVTKTEDMPVFASALGAKPGSLGAVRQALRGQAADFPIYADERLRGASHMTTGANKDGFHFRHVAVNRDIQVGHWADLRVVRAGEPCPKCGQALRAERAIEVGHVFKLGVKYSLALNALFLDESGKQQPAIMGCYGIGVTRTLQAVIEQSHDDAGIIWPMSVAPYTVCITPLNTAPESAVMKQAEKIYAELTARGVDVILDDRNDRPGVKFKDSELVGFPIRIGIGEKSLAKGEVEIKPRVGAMVPVKADEAVAQVLRLVSAT